MKRSDRGSALLAVLLILSILLVLGIGLLSQRANQYEEMRRANEACQARALAQAGLVDVKLKLSKDRSFPPARPNGETRFTYSETMTDVDGNEVGRYVVTVMTDTLLEPFYVMRVESIGLIGTEGANPRARYVIYGELDLAKTVRNDENQTPNPNYFRWLYFQEGDRPTDLFVEPLSF